MNLEENDIVICKVKRIEGTTVFLEIEGNGEGTMVFSEVSPGRIRNIRDYITINKRIVCKVLRIKEGHPLLSLRRVTAKERESVLETVKKEKMLENMLRPVLKDKTHQALEKIKSSHELEEFLDEARENPELLEKIASNSELEQLKKIFTEKRETEKEVKKIIMLKTNSPSGLEEIKQTLKLEDEKIEIHYLGSSSFSIAAKASDFKQAKNILEQALEKIKANAKRFSLKIEVKEK